MTLNIKWPTPVDALAQSQHSISVAATTMLRLCQEAVARAEAVEAEAIRIAADDPSKSLLLDVDWSVCVVKGESK